MKKTLFGKVVSIKQHNTVVVEVVRKITHPLYKKLLTRSKKFSADAKGIKLTIGDMVAIVETIPLSKTKNFKVIAEGGEKK
jgi:small subunit ribosomal protein S17